MRFQLGRVVATRNCLEHMASIGSSVIPCLERHKYGDWGNLGDADKQANEQALQHGGRILSRYVLKDGTPVYVITEADRSYTTVMLASDY